MTAGNDQLHLSPASPDVFSITRAARGRGCHSGDVTTMVDVVVCECSVHLFVSRVRIRASGKMWTHDHAGGSHGSGLWLV